MPFVARCANKSVCYLCRQRLARLRMVCCCIFLLLLLYFICLLLHFICFLLYFICLLRRCRDGFGKAGGTCTECAPQRTINLLILCVMPLIIVAVIAWMVRVSKYALRFRKHILRNFVRSTVQLCLRQSHC